MWQSNIPCYQTRTRESQKPRDATILTHPSIHPSKSSSHHLPNFHEKPVRRHETSCQQTQAMTSGGIHPREQNAT